MVRLVFMVLVCNRVAFVFFRSTQAILVLCRGVFTPQNDVVETKWEHHVFAAVFQPDSGGYPLAGAFAEVRCDLLPQSSVCFLSVLIRCSNSPLRLVCLSPISFSSSTAHRCRLTTCCPAPPPTLCCRYRWGFLRSKKGVRTILERYELPGRRFPSWNHSQGAWNFPCWLVGGVEN